MKIRFVFLQLLLFLSVTCSTQTYIPFNHQSPPIPAASAGNDLQSICGVAFTLQGVVTGGTAPFIIQWSPAAYLNNPAILNPIGNIPVSTTFQLRVTDVNGCVSIDSVRVTCQNVGLEEDSWNAIRIYPNPSQARFRIEGIPADENIIELSCQSLTGVEVLRKVMIPEGQALDLDLGGLSPGIYCIRLQGAGSRTFQRVVIL